MKTPLFNIDALNKITAEQAAQAAESVARNRACDALNRVNRMTAAYDTAVADLKKSMPRDCDWGKK